jgi:hypothetical protein
MYSPIPSNSCREYALCGSNTSATRGARIAVPDFEVAGERLRNMCRCME